MTLPIPVAREAIVTRAQHARGMENAAYADLDRRLKRLAQRRYRDTRWGPAMTVEENDEWRTWALWVFDRDLAAAREFARERCRDCAGTGHEQIEVPEFGKGPPYPTIDGDPCRSCLGSGRHR